MAPPRHKKRGDFISLFHSGPHLVPPLSQGRFQKMPDLPPAPNPEQGMSAMGAHGGTRTSCAAYHTVTLRTAPEVPLMRFLVCVLCGPGYPARKALPRTKGKSSCLTGVAPAPHRGKQIQGLGGSGASQSIAFPTISRSRIQPLGRLPWGLFSLHQLRPVQLTGGFREPCINHPPVPTLEAEQ